MKHSFAVMNKGSDVVSGGYVPYSHCGIRRSGYDNPLVVLQTENGSRVSSQHSLAGKRVAIPHLDSVVSQTRDNFLIVVLQAIDTFGIFTTAIDPLEVVFATSPVTFNGLNILK